VAKRTNIATLPGRRPVDYSPGVDADLRTYLDQRFGAMDQRFESMDHRFESMDRRFDTMDQRFDAMDQRFDAVDQRFDAVDQRFDAVDQRFVGVDRRFDAIDLRFEGIDHRFDGVARRFVELDGELRRHFGVLVEQVRQELRIVAEMVVANTEAISQLRLRLDAR
jgi:archaellum component FlaC